MATTRIYKVSIPATAAVTLLVDAMTPASAKRVLAERLISVDVAGGKDIIAAMRDGAEVVSAREDAPESLPLPGVAPGLVPVAPLPPVTGEQQEAAFAAILPEPTKPKQRATRVAAVE